MNNKIRGIIKVLIVLIILALSWLTVSNWSFVAHLFGDKEYLKTVINSFGALGFLILAFFQALQILIAFIPGELTQIAAGYILGFWIGFIAVEIGTMVGSIAVFYISRFLGKDFVEKHVSKGLSDKLYNTLNGAKGESVLFLLFLIPGLPKDVFCYIMGITNIKAKNFFIILFFARLPAIVLSVLFGSNLAKGNFVLIGIIALVISIIFLLGFIFKNQIIEKLKEKYNGKV